MARQNFEFELYRINIVQEDPYLFREMNKAIANDKDILKILKHATSPAYKKSVEGKKNTFEWDIREYNEYYHERSDIKEIYGVTLAKSTVKTTGDIVTDIGIEEGISKSEPPIAHTCKLFFYMKRHLMIIERRSAIINSGWRGALEEILKTVAHDLSFIGSIEFEPYPNHAEIIKAFHSFDKLTRMRVILRLPNPEYSRFAAKLFSEMQEGKIREYLQDMKNFQGLNKEEGKIPHASAELAAAGYKKGEVTFEGVRNKKRESVKTGKDAAHGQIQGMKDYVRGMNTVLKSKEAKRAMTSILDEIDRIAPAPDKKA